MALRRTTLLPEKHIGPKDNIPNVRTYKSLLKVLAYVPAGSQNFARSLLQNHETYGGWTPRQNEHATLLLERARQTYYAGMQRRK